MRIEAADGHSADPGSGRATQRRRRRRLGLLLTATAGLCVLLAAGAQADPPSNLASAPATGAAIVAHGEFTNLYLWPDPEKETWDEHLIKVAETDPAATSERLNELTTTLVGTSYFDLLTQYGIEPPSFNGEEVLPAKAWQECVEQTKVNAEENGGVIQWEGETKYVGCAHSHGLVVSPQVNLFASPDLKVAEFMPFAGVRPDMCTAGATAYHTKDLEVADFTVVPINTKCNSNLAAVSQSISHEMTEVLSDPGGFGYINESVAPRVLAMNFNQDYNEGELADICEGIGLHPTPHLQFENASFGTLEVGPYWSNADAECAPPRIMNLTLANLTGANKLEDGSTGLVRLTSKAKHRELPVPLIEPPSLSRHYLQALELEIRTGGDNLNGGNALSDGVSVELNFKFRKKPLVLEHVNEGQEWANNSLHAVELRVPKGIRLEDLTGMTVTTAFNGNDNWDIADATVKAAVACAGTGVGRPCNEEAEPPECPLVKTKTGAPPPSQPEPLLELNGKKLLEDGSKGLVRLTGSLHSFTKNVKVDKEFAELQLADLQLSIRTGGDDLRSGPLPGENANATIKLNSSQSITFTDINDRQKWSNFSPSGTITLPLSALPEGTTLGDIKSLTISTEFSGDNWDILGISLEGATRCLPGPDPLPKPTEVTVAEQVGHATLPDGHEGLFRFTGGAPMAFPIPLMPVPASDSAKEVTGLELIVGTSGDDIGGGNTPHDNADATLMVAGHQVTFTDVNRLEKWSNDTSNSEALLTLAGLPPGTTMGQLSGPLEIQTNFNGGTEGENWDLSAVKLVAVGF